MNRRQMLETAGATPYETLWTSLETDKPAFIAKMGEEQKTHVEKMKLQPRATMGNWEYEMMQLVWTDFHQSGGKRAPPPPPPAPPHPEAEFWDRMRMPLNPGSAQPALTQTRPHEQVVQWVQGNRILMRPTDREVMPGERMASVHIVR